MSRNVLIALGLVVVVAAGFGIWQATKSRGPATAATEPAKPTPTEAQKKPAEAKPEEKRAEAKPDEKKPEEKKAEEKKPDEKKAEEKKPEEKKADPPKTTAAEDGSGEMFIGKADAPITIIAYESLTCPHCAAFHTGALPKLKEKYVDKGVVRIIFREFPGTSREPWSRFPAMMARCLGPDRYFSMIDLMFKDQDKWMKAETGQQLLDNVAAYGRLAGMSKDQFDACMKNEKILRAMADRWREGIEKHGLEGTPHFVIGDKRISGNRPIEEFEQALKPLVDKLPKN